MESTLGCQDASEEALSTEGNSGSVAGFVGSPNPSVLRSDDPSLFEYLRQEPEVPPNPFSSQLGQQYVPAFPEVTAQVRCGTAPSLNERRRFYDVDVKIDDNDFGVSWLPILRGLVIAVLVGALVLTIAYVRGIVWSGALGHEGHTQAGTHLPASADEVDVVHGPLVEQEASMPTASTRRRHPASLAKFSTPTAKSYSRGENAGDEARAGAGTRPANITLTTADTSPEAGDDFQMVAFPEQQMRRRMNPTTRKTCSNDRAPTTSDLRTS